MIITKTYIDKINTLVKDSYVNLSLNPVMELNYGKMLTRGIIYFDHNKIKNMVNEKIYPDTDKLHHILKMTNCASITSKHINKPCLTSEYDDKKERAISFDLIFFLIPDKWDDGRGFDYVQDLYSGSHKSISTDASNWYQFKNYYKWSQEGIYSLNNLFKEYDLFTNKVGNLSKIIIGKQHFEYGNENIEIDITEIFNKFLNNEITNNGIGIAFAPYYENIETKKSQYVGFFTNHTNSFYKPYIETYYEEYIEDDRTNFYLDKPNKLYFYASVNEHYVNLDEIPTCTINGVEMVVKQCSKGIYYAEVNLSSKEYEDNVMLYDIWDNIKYNNRVFEAIELNFVTISPNKYYSFGLPLSDSKKKDIIPSIYGINDNEQIQIGDIRKINIDCKIPYSSDKKYSIDGLYYRLYVKEGEKQIDVINWTQVEKGYNENYFYINTNDLIPFRYFIDIKYNNGTEIINYNNIIEFDIINDVTNKFN